MHEYSLPVVLPLIGLTLLTVLLASTQAAASEADVAKIRERLLANWGSRGYDIGRVRNWIEHQDANGRWNDLKYDGRGAALTRAVEIARAWRDPKSSLAGDGKGADAIRRGLAYWLEQDPKDPNWWHNEIGAPMRLCELGILGWDGLSPDLQKALCGRLEERSKIGMTGQNLVWLARINVIRGVLSNDAGLIGKATARLWQEITDGNPEGLQPDASFYQHGKLLYSGGYGRVFSADMADLSSLMRGTEWAIPKKKLDLLLRYVLDGQQWMLYGTNFDLNARGREVARRAGDSRWTFRSVTGNLRRLDLPRRGEIEALAARISDGKDGAPLLGNRYFRYADLMIHRRNGWYSSVKMTSDRICGTETGNGEGLLNHFLMLGVNIHLRTGEEYYNIYPVWDWAYVPGVTTDLTEELAPQHNWTHDTKGTMSFVGGVSDGESGLAAMDHDMDGVTFRRCWAMLPDAEIVLTADLRSTSDRPVHTAMDQCWAKGKSSVVTASDKEGKLLEEGKLDVSDARAVLHDGMTYLFPKPMPVSIRMEPRRDSWRKLSKTGPAQSVEGKVFQLSVEHGVRPAGESFVYCISPAGEQAATDKVGSNMGEVLANARSLQAVRSADGTVLAAFYEAGELKIRDVGTLAVDQPCLVMLRATDAGWRAHVSDPTQKLPKVTLTLTAAGQEHAAAVQLPTGREAGRTTTVDLK